MRTLVERASRWLVNNRRPPLDSQATVDQFAGPVQATMAQLPELMTGRELEAFQDRLRRRASTRGVPEDLARRVAVLEPAYMLLGIVETAACAEELAPEDVARVHFALGERLGLPVLLQRIVALPREDKWQTMARAALRDDLHGVHTAAHRPGAARAPRRRPARRPGSRPGRTATRSWWPGRRDPRADLRRGGGDLARMSVGLRVVRAARRLTRFDSATFHPSRGGKMYCRRRETNLPPLSPHHEGVQPTEQEFAELFRASWARLYRLAYAVSGDAAAAEDDLQNAFAKVYASWGRVHRAEHPEAYLRRIVLNEVLGGRRRGFVRRERPRSDVEPPGRVASPEDAVVGRDLIWTAVRALPPRQRAVVVLRYYEDLSEAEIADTLGCSRGTVKSQASAALTALRKVAPDLVREDS